MNYFVVFSSFAIILKKEERAGYFAFLVFQASYYCKCSMGLQHRAGGWSTVCDCGISCSYLLIVLSLKIEIS